MTARFLRDVPIKRKLTIITMAATALALGVTGVSLAIYNQIMQRRDLTSDISTIAQVVAYNSAAALSFSDPASAELTLKAFEVQENIVAARIYTPDGEAFATYFRTVDDVARLPDKAPPERTVFGRSGLELVRDITFAGEKLGTICLETDSSEMADALTNSLIAIVVALVIGALIAYVVASRLQRVISDPVSQLATVAAQVASANNYSVRAVKQGDDEVGALIEGFNAMLTQIQLRDAALHKAHDELEARVEQRTRALVLEIAERRQTEEERDGFFKLSADLLCIAGMNGFVRRANPAFEPVLGYSEQEMANFRFMDFVHPDDFVATAWRVRRVSGGRSVHDFENRVRHRDGSYRWIAWSVTPAPGNQYFYACGRDITALKEAQERAAREKARLQLIFDSVPVGISLRYVHPDGGCTRMLNDAHLRICGLTREQAEDRDIFRRISDPDDYRLQAALNQRLAAGDVGGYRLEKRYRRLDGKTVWVLLARQRHEYRDGGYEDLTTIFDITELKRAQEEVAVERARFKFIFDSVPVGIALVLPGEQETRLVNPAHERITGIPSSEGGTPGVYEKASHPEDYERQRPLIAAFKRGEIDRFTLEKRYVHANGRVVWVALSRRMFVDEQTGLQQAITTIVDITERKEAEARLAETHRQLLETSRAAGMAEVATGVLHNVGNVLNSVNVSATLLNDMVRDSEVGKLGRLSELLAAQGPDLGKFFAADPRATKVAPFIASLAEHLQREQRECLAELESLRKNIEHIKEIVAMQQNYAKVSGVSESISVSELVEDALRMNAGALARHEITLVRDFQANPMLLTEKHKVLQILVNLMRNAKYACEESGRPEKRMTVRVVMEDASVKVSVIDNGVGIPPQNLTRIFSHGFTTKKNGHGFGLHSGALAAKELGGSLLAQSDGPGHGACFVLTLPLGGDAMVA